jgi:hypothetical protein
MRKPPMTQNLTTNYLNTINIHPINLKKLPPSPSLWPPLWHPPSILAHPVPTLFSDSLNESVATKTTSSSSEAIIILDKTGRIVEFEALYNTDLKPFIKDGELNVKDLPFVIFGIFGKSSVGKDLITDSECLVLTIKFPEDSSRIILLSETLLIKLFSIVPETATLPGFKTFTGILISIPKSRFVALIVSVEFFASSKIQLKTGRVIFFEVILSALLTA